MRLAPSPPWPEVPAEVGRLRLAAAPLGPATEVLPIGGADISAAIEQTVGIGAPPANRSFAGEDVRVLWFGRDALLVLGAHVKIDGALCVDQSDAWAALALAGEVRDALARLCPLDLREASFPVDATARTLLGPVTVSLTRTAPEDWLLLVPRSMSEWVLQQIIDAAEGVAGRTPPG